MRKFAIWIIVAAFFGAIVGAGVHWTYNKRLAHLGQQTTDHSKEKTDEALADYTLWLMLFTGVLAVATIGLGVATTGLYLTGEKQVAITREALIGDQRAWLITSLEIGPGGLQYHDDSYTLDVRLKVSNVGRTPALGAHSNMKIVTDVNRTGDEVARLAKESRKLSPHGLFLSPNDFYFRPWGATTEGGLGPHPDIATPILVGCVTYKILQDDELHQVAFVYLLGRKDGSSWGELISTNNCPADQIVISPWAGGFAT